MPRAGGDHRSLKTGISETLKETDDRTPPRWRTLSEIFHDGGGHGYNIWKWVRRLLWRLIVRITTSYLLQN
ncbi:kinase domain-containing protein [Nannizzia gypsea CBS 118893]|uniref:Kinase domain-containing protein n=1 Tax=Arthroderma gypseum (strain ATCC MYA-4604 / CBS 118893) TaxID=535722 RepID=E4V1P6_ARTGP|nr:kinase domain-containing protein [Nannizzia gypsea CBS 118893]EFR03961.1 kinase domain-containing protein [Nannizzia gypsea CBS 118893]